MRTDLHPCDVLLYRDTDWLGRFISLGEHDGGKELFQYSHAGLVIDPTNDQGFEMNPPRSAWTSLKAQDWSRIDVFRPTVALSANLVRGYCNKNLGIPYPYGEIGKFLIADQMAELGLVGFSKWLNGLWDTEDPHLMECSATVAAALSFGSLGRMGWPRPDTNMRPCDLPLGNLALVVIP